MYIYIIYVYIGKVVRCLWTPSPEKHEACGSETRIVAVKVQYKLCYILYAYVFAFGKNAWRSMSNLLAYSVDLQLLCILYLYSLLYTTHLCTIYTYTPWPIGHGEVDEYGRDVPRAQQGQDTGGGHGGDVV